MAIPQYVSRQLQGDSAEIARLSDLARRHQETIRSATAQLDTLRGALAGLYHDYNVRLDMLRVVYGQDAQSLGELDEYVLPVEAALFGDENGDDEPAGAATAWGSSAGAVPPAVEKERAVAAPSAPAVPFNYRWGEFGRRDGVLRKLIELGGATFDAWRDATVSAGTVPTGRIFQGHAGNLKKIGAVTLVGDRWLPLASLAPDRPAE